MGITNDVLSVMDYDEYYSNASIAEELSKSFSEYAMLDEGDLKRKISGSLNRIYRIGYLECVGESNRKDENNKYIYSLKRPEYSEHQNNVMIANDSESIVGNDKFLNSMFGDSPFLNYELEDFEEFCGKLSYIENYDGKNMPTTFMHERDILWLKCLWLTGGRAEPLRQVKRKDLNNSSILITKKFSSEIRTRELFINESFINEIYDFCDKHGVKHNDFIFSSSCIHNKIKERYILDEETDFSTRGIRYGNELLLRDLSVAEPVINWRHGYYVANENKTMDSDVEQMEPVIEYMMECWDLN